MSKLILVAPTTKMKIMRPRLRIVAAELTNEDSLTPITRNEAMKMVRENASQSGYGPRLLTCIGIVLRSVLLITLPDA